MSVYMNPKDEMLPIKLKYLTNHLIINLNRCVGFIFIFSLFFSQKCKISDSL